jgi:hypothetical protein
MTAFFLAISLGTFGEYPGRLCGEPRRPAGARGRNVAAKTRLATGIDQALADRLLD